MSGPKTKDVNDNRKTEDDATDDDANDEDEDAGERDEMMDIGMPLRDEAEEDVSEHPAKKPPPDGGWGWMIVIAAIITQMSFGYIARAFGVIYLEFLAHYGESPSVTGGIGAVSQTALGLFGPVASILCNRFSCRATTILGAFSCTLGFALTAISPNVYICYFTFGILVGGGLALAFTPGFIIISQYFVKRRALALALASVGASLGTLVFPPIVIHIYSDYGYFGGCLILSAVCLHPCIAGALYRPLNPRIPNKLSPKPSNTQNGLATNDSQGPVEQNTTLKDGVVPEIRPASRAQQITRSQQHKGTRKRKYSQYPRDSITVVSFKRLQEPAKYEKPPLIDIKLFCDLPYVGLFVMFIALAFNIAIESGYLPAFAMEYGITKKDAAFLITVSGITSLIGNVVLGMCLDIGKVKEHRILIYAALNVIGAVGCLIQPYVMSYMGIIVMVIIRTLAYGVVMSQRVTIVGDIVGQERIGNAFGLSLLANSMGSLAGRASGGILKDQLGSYSSGYFLAGAFHIIGSLFFIFTIVLHRRRQSSNTVQDASKEMPPDKVV